jgi:hypothetical protein
MGLYAILLPPYSYLSRIAYRRTAISFFGGCACHVCDQPCLPSLWLNPRNDYSATAPAACSLRPFVLSGSLIRCHAFLLYHYHPFPRATLWTSHLSLWRGLTSPQCSVPHFLWPSKRPKFSLFVFKLMILSEDLIKCLLALQTQLPSRASVPYANVAFRSRITSFLRYLSFRGSMCSIILAWPLTTVCLAGYRMDQLFLGSGRLLPGSTIALDLFVWLSAMPYG